MIGETDDKVGMNPLRMFAVVLISAASIEMIIMVLLESIITFDDLRLVVLADSLLLAVALAPIVYFLELRPVRKLVNRLIVANAELWLSNHVFEQGCESIIVINTEWICTMRNPCAFDMIGIDKGDAVVPFFAKKEDAARLKSDLDLKEKAVLDVNLIGKSGAQVSVVLCVSKVPANNSIDDAFVITATDVSELIQTRDNLLFLAKHDPVSSLPNAIAFEATLDSLKTKLDISNSNIVVAALRICNFRWIEDMYGNDALTIYIRDIASGLEAYLGSGMVARLQKDEIGVVLDGFYDHDDLEFRLKKVSKIVSADRLIQGRSLSSDTEIGYRRLENNTDSNEVISDATIAMRTLAGSRLEIVEYQSCMQRELQEKADFIDRIKTAVLNKEFSVVFQPQVSIHHKRIIGVEALLRWIQPNGEFISPEVFVPELERQGYIYDVGLWVLELCCNKGREWLDKGYGPFVMAVNVSALQLLNDNFPRDVLSILARSHFPPNLLELEFTESCMVADPKAAEQLMNDLGALGVKIAIDDFGTGYSSLSYLKKFKMIDKLKIDKSFVDSIGGDNDTIITDAVIALAKSLNLTAIAEGVESEEQSNYLRQHGCDQIQGYLISKPLSEQDLLLFFDKGTDAEQVL